MRKKLIFLLRNLAKMAVQKLILPIAYELARLSYRGERTLYVFADAHHTELPFSLAAMYEHVVSLGIEPVCHFHDYTHEGSLKSVLHSIAFMKLRDRWRRCRSRSVVRVTRKPLRWKPFLPTRRMPLSG